MSELKKEDKPDRLFFIDNLRVALTVLVILHHLSVIYAANTSFYYLEKPNDAVGTVMLVMFQLLNQAYFMGFFFFLAGLFTPGSFERRGPLIFIRDRLLRLGVPLLLFYFLLGPVASIGYFQIPASIGGDKGSFFWRMGVGPLWFVVMLLAFDLCYCLWRVITRKMAVKPVADNAPAFWKIGVFVLALALTSYLIRIPLPFTKYVWSFPSLAYLPQYISFFILGTMALRRGWLRRISDSAGKIGFGAAVASIILLLPIAMSTKFGPAAAFEGNGTFQSAIYALWDSVFSVGVCLGAITYFRYKFNHQRGLGRALAKSTFTVYIIHCPVIVMLALAMRTVHTDSFLKFLMAACIGVPLCFALAYVIRKIPFADRIL